MDLETGQQSRDMTLFVDDDRTAYVVYASEKNSTLHLAELDRTYTGFTGRYWRLFPWRWMEAPVLFKRNGKYYFIGSGCTGWAPNAARSAVADRLAGPWTELGNPAVDAGGDITYGAQGTFALQLAPGRNHLHGRSLESGKRNRRPLPLAAVEWKAERPILREPAYQCLCRNLV